jgi:energy-coupling factor transporter ATP-binding protein EcfA2
MTFTAAEFEAQFLADLDRTAPFLTWPEFLDVFEWQPSQHIGVIGPTGSGKTNLAVFLIGLRKYVVALATKPRDDTMDGLASLPGWVKFKKWTSRPARYFPKRIIWPDATKLYSQNEQQAQFRKALEHIYVSGEWTVFIDELWYIIHTLRMEYEVKLYLLQARSNGISLLALSQRPAWIPVELFDQSSHLFFYRDNDERNLKTIAGISWLSAKKVQAIVARLEEFQFLYINTRTGKMYRSIAPAPGEEG